MIIEISGKQLEITPSLKEYAEEKLGSLAKFVERYDEEGAVKLKVVLSRNTMHHNKGEVYEAKGDLILPGQDLYGEVEHEDAHAAVDLLRSKILREVETYKAKHEHE